MLKLIYGKKGIVLLEDRDLVASGIDPTKFVENLFKNEGDSAAQAILGDDDVFSGISPTELEEIRVLITAVNRGDSITSLTAIGMREYCD